MTTLTPDVMAAKMAAWNARKAKMYFATKDFSASYGGQTVKFWRGESFSQSHEIPRRFPGNFVLLGEYPDWSSEAINARKNGGTRRRPKSRTVPVRSDRLKGEIPRPGWIMPDAGPKLPLGEAVELRASRSPVTVTLSHLARTDIVDDAAVTPGHERGAFTVGTHTAGAIDVRMANTTNLASRSGTGALAMAYGYEMNWVRRQREIHGSHLSLNGSWHTHPTGNLNPSDADLREWSRMMLAGREFGHAPTHAGLIVDPARGKIAAWVVRRNQQWPNNLVCERAEIRR